MRQLSAFRVIVPGCEELGAAGIADAPAVDATNLARTAQLWESANAQDISPGRHVGMTSTRRTAKRGGKEGICDGKKVKQQQGD